MKRKSTVKVQTTHGIIKATVEFDLSGLTIGEGQRVVDDVSEGVVDALRRPPYGPVAPLRSVTLR